MRTPPRQLRRASSRLAVLWKRRALLALARDTASREGGAWKPPISRRGFLGVPGANLLHVGVEDLGLGCRVLPAPHEYPLGPDVDVDPGVIPVEQPAQRLRRGQARAPRKLPRRLSRVAPAVGLEVAIVH